MAIITVPTKFGFTRVNKFTLQRAGNSLRSKYTGQGQFIVYPYAVWMLEANLVEYDGVDAGRIRAFLALLEGQKNTFRLPVPGFSKPSTGVTYNLQVSTAAIARASSIVMKGAAASVALFNEGDYFTIQDELKIVTAAVSSNASGIATVSFQPPLRKAAVINVAITLQNPTCLMRAAEDDVAGWGISAPVRQATKFEAIEAVEI